MALLGPEGRCGLRDATLPAAPSPAETGQEQEVLRTFPVVAMVPTIGKPRASSPAKAPWPLRRTGRAPACHERSQDSE